MTVSQKPPRSLTTPDRLVAAAFELFNARGYAGTGIADILKSADLPKGSLYHHFPGGKEDLALACADAGSAVVLRLLDRAMAEAATPAQAIDRFTDEMARAFDRHGGLRGCPVTSILVDNGGPTRFGERARIILSDWETAFRAHYARLGVGDPQALAQQSVTLLQGGWAQARTFRDPGRLESALRQIKAGLN